MATNDSSGSIMAVPQDTQTSADVGPSTTELFNDAGVSIFVKDNEVEYWTSNGFRKTKFDIEATRSALKAYLGATALAVDEFVNGVLADEQIDTADQAALAAAMTALSLVAETWNQLYSDAFRRYSVVSSNTATKMLDLEGNTTDIDPGQVALYLDKGFTEVK